MTQGTTVAALYVPGRGDPVADMLPRFMVKAYGVDPYPGREPRSKWRDQVRAACGVIDVDLLASDGGSNAWDTVYRSPANSAFEGPLPDGRLRWFPLFEMIELVSDRLHRVRREGRPGGAFYLVLFQLGVRWHRKLCSFDGALRFPREAALFVHRQNGRPELVPNEGLLVWDAIKLRSCALGVTLEGLVRSR